MYNVLKIEPLTLQGRYIILRHPLIDDLEGLSIAARDGEVWNSHFAQFPHPNEMQKYIQEMLNLRLKWFNLAIYNSRQRF
jgi:hypothetical protein